MFVVSCSTPAQYFHALRRQANLPYKKPLVLLTPKYLLHHKPATSALQDLATGEPGCGLCAPSSHSMPLLLLLCSLCCAARCGAVQRWATGSVHRRT